MNIYLISQKINDDFDTYDSAVVAAETEDDARLTHPDGAAWDKGTRNFTWVPLERVNEIGVRLLGTAADGIEKGVISASFNAG